MELVLVTVFENMGEHGQARELIDQMLARREGLSGETRKQVEQLRQRTRVEQQPAQADSLV